MAPKANVRRARSWPVVLALVAMVAATAWLAGLSFFVRTMPDTVADATTRTDAIVVLTGGSERIRTGVRLLSENRGDRVFVSGVNPDVELSAVLALNGGGGALSGRIDSGHDARDTLGNATETAGWMKVRGYRSLRLVTSYYHMPRSLLEFHRAMPEARIIPHPVFPESVREEQWWLRPGMIALLAGEFHKYLWAWLIHPFGQA